MSSRIHCGPFEAEAYWREPDLMRLPSIPDKSAERIVEAMDEMLFTFCNADDGVLTANRMNDAHVDYLHAIGFRFKHNHFDLAMLEDGSEESGAQITPSVFQRMADGQFAESLKAFFPEGARLEPFAVMPEAAEVARRYRLHGAFPPQDVIRRVNRKSYSLRVRDRLGIPNVGVIVEDVTSFLNVGLDLLRGGAFLVKDEYGVSGKGNQLIETEAALQRIGRYLSAQEVRRRRMRFVVEPLLPKRSDFSCQFRVEEDGHFTLLCVQELANNGLAFGASCSARPELLESLDRSGYFELIEKIGAELHADGYFGDVCVDSMVLSDGEFVPLVEINARKSMSLIKHAIDRYLTSMNRGGYLTYVSAVKEGTSDFSTFLDVLHGEGILFTPEYAEGILPLTCGTMYRTPASNATPPKRGRFYVAVICDDAEGRVRLLAALGHAMERTGLLVTH